MAHPPATDTNHSSPDPTAQTLTAPSITVSLTTAPLSPTTAIHSVRSPKAGATVLFAGTTRDTSPTDTHITHLEYTAYTPLALKSMLAIAERVKAAHDLTAVSMSHRLGICPVGEESILIAVSAPHRAAAWRGGEQALEECKARVEIWKKEEGMWREN